MYVWISITGTSRETIARILVARQKLMTMEVYTFHPFKSLRVLDLPVAIALFAHLICLQ